MTPPAIDLIITGLLICSVAYAALVDRRVRRLMAALEALGPAVEAMSDAADRTEGSVSALREASAGIAPRPEAAPEEKADLIERFFRDAERRGV